MFLFSMLVITLSSYEIYNMAKNKRTRDIAIYVCLALILLCAGLLYISAPYKYSFSESALKLIGKNY